MQEIGPDVRATAQVVIELVSAWGLRLLGAIVLLVAGRVVAGWSRRIVRRALVRAQVEPTLAPFVSGLVYWLVLAIVVVAVLGMVGVQTASLIAVFGAAGLAVGLALQGTLSNFASGVMLLLFRPFRVGDYIEAGGAVGTVEAIGMFSTTLNTPDNVKIIIPNSSVDGRMIKNYAANPTRRNDITLKVSPDDDIAVAIETVRKALAADERVLDQPEPFIGVSEISGASVSLEVRAWCRREDYGALRSDLMRALKERLEAAGCSIR
jgi:small conductance mechanosensitive channel